MGKKANWIKAVIANQQPYANMAQVDIKKSAERLFEKDGKKKEKENTK